VAAITARHRVGLAAVHDDVGAELSAQGQARLPGASENHAGGPERLHELDRHESDGTGTQHGHRLAGEVTAGVLEPKSGLPEVITTVDSS
jgi:hypothetical protein